MPTKERATRIRCFCPPDIFVPFSLIMVCIPIGIWRISSARPTISAACQASSMVRGKEPIILLRIFPAIIRPCCITTPICRLTEATSRLFKSCPSYCTSPRSGRSSPNKIRTKVDLPQPELPTNATKLPGSICRFICFRARGKSGL